MLSVVRKWFLVIVLLFVLTFFALLFERPLIDLKVYSLNEPQTDDGNYVTYENYKDLKNGGWRKLTKFQINKLSNLGKMLYLGDSYSKTSNVLKNYTILVWKQGLNLERRHIKRYTNQRFDPFEQCSVNNCQITYKDADLTSADLVVFHLHRIRGVHELPKVRGSPEQIWTFLTDESPFHTFLHSKNNSMQNYNGMFNWSMTYRKDSDIPVPYGRTVLLKDGERMDTDYYKKWNKGKKQDVLVAIMGSNCGGRNHRWKYVKELEKYIRVDKYGACGTLKCPGHFTKDCKDMLRYKYYLSFENSNCDEYVTEKLWWNGYAKNALPIVMGTSKSICQQLLPPNSYIHVEDFASPRDLANYLIYLNNTPVEIKKFFEWKKRFRVLNEHGYFGTASVHYCRICEALNYNDKKSKVYDNLEKFWSKSDCHASWDNS